MARHKTITREQILESAYTLVVEQGFKRFTARNIAAEIGCSTQPIYLEFNNMAELRDAVMERIKQELTEKFNKVYTNDPVIDMALTYIDFALENHNLYQAVFVEDHFGVDDMRSFSINAAQKRLENYEAVQHLSAAQKNNIISGLWIVATGIADLMTSGFISMSHAQMIDVLQVVIQEFIENGRLSGNTGEDIITRAARQSSQQNHNGK
ncbi:TetR/AcrR family transcriptional regulator [Lacticaseibacillus zhaodongensis]|uniref:TetR/AcrR family transcriptional regulator n=1 Tax=Lacticaseibacillus zhaodongensis TaxID=2668065 RepID=UPI0012D30107|nr:TetR/AcrR family transcriptional regulator [Lacticaseibacillus zhaodongensis]